MNDIVLLKDFEQLYRMPIILYGTGSCGKLINGRLEEIGVEVYGFCDSNLLMWGKRIEGKKVFSIEELKELEAKEDIIIIIASEFVEDINNVLKHFKIKCQKVFSSVAFQFALWRYLIANQEKYKDTSLYNILLVPSELRRHHENYLIKSIKEFFDRRRSNRNPILVYNQGKVASCTVAVSIRNYGLTALHIHTISRFLKVPARKLFHQDEKVKIISFCREPIARDFSMYFQSVSTESFYLEAYQPEYLQEVVNFMKIISGMTEIPCDMIPPGDEFLWFDREIKEMFDVDIYQYPFDREAGYSIIRKDNIEILLLKVEKLNTLEKVIGDFVGISDFKLQNYNEVKDKIVSGLYMDTKNEIKLPRDYVDFYYKDNPYMNHFYTEEEKKQFLEKWKNQFI